MYTEQVSVTHGQLDLHAHSVLEVLPRLLILLLRDQIAHDTQSMGKSQGDVQAGPPARPLVGVIRVVLVNQVHEGCFVEERKHAVEVFKVVFQQGKGLGFGWELAVYATLEDVLEDVGSPLDPLVVLDGGGRYHVLERVVSRLVIDPLYTFGRENGKARR